jgi:4-carboxymuconolactone decarboxylase
LERCVSQPRTPGREALIALSAALAAGDASRRDEVLRHARSSASAVEEAILQSHHFLGYPAALNALAAWREISGIELERQAESAGESWAERGERVCQAVYGGQYEALRENIRRLHPDMERWMVEDGYGRVIGRAGLPLVERELCIVALLAVLDAPRQLYAHLRGALNVGAEEPEVARALEIAATVSDDDARARAVHTWQLVLARSARAG